MNRLCLALLLLPAAFVGCGKSHEETTNAANPPAAPAAKASDESDAGKAGGRPDSGKVDEGLVQDFRFSMQRTVFRKSSIAVSLRTTVAPLRT